MTIICDICEKESIQFLKINKYPQFTINSDSLQKISMNRSLILKIYFCSSCKNIFSRNTNSYQSLYTNHKAKSINLKKNINKIRKAIQKIVRLKKKDKVIEISKNNIFDKKYINKKKLIFKKINLGNFNKEFDYRKFKDIKLILCYDFLGNIKNLNSFFSIVSKILRYDGSIICQHHYGPSLLRNLTLDRVYSEHLNYLSITTLNKISLKHNLIIQKISFFEKKNFFNIKISKNKKKICKKKVKLILKKEKKINLYNLKYFLNEIEKIKIRLSALLKNQLYKNHVVYGFGSSIGALPIILYFNLDKKISFLLDDNPLKKFFPLKENKIQIINPNSINNKKKKIIICLAPRYFKLIRKKTLRQLDKGDILINLLPKFTIIKKR